MPMHTMSSFGISHAFRKSKKSQTRGGVPQLVVDVKDAKSHRILGIIPKERSSARSGSVSSSSTARQPASSFSNATTASVSSRLSPEDKSSPTSIKKLNSKASSVLLRDEADTTSTSGPPSVARLSLFPSSSTLHSHYEASKAPLSISQQTSNSSSRDFALRKGTSAVISRKSQEMEHALQMLFFKASKPKPREVKQVSQRDSQYPEGSFSSPVTSGSSAHSQRDNANVASRSSISLPATPVSSGPGKKLFPGLRRTESQQIRPSPGAAGAAAATRDPYAKINVRRPKVGARNWFDDVDDDLSESECNDEPVASSQFVNQVEQVFAATESVAKSATTNSISAISTLSTAPDTPDITPIRRSSSFRRTKLPAGSSRALLTEHRPAPRNVSFQEVSPIVTDEQSIPSKKLHTRPSTLAAADLSTQSILCLSSSDDEDDNEPAQRSKSPESLPKLRESLAADPAPDSEIEVGVARAVKANSGEPIVRASHPRAEALRRVQNIPIVTNVPLRRASRHASYLLDNSTENENSEADIIGSFPATPSDSNSLRTSIRSSVFSDTGSLASTRPMLVTKQEEKLLAAMRLKKAALRRTERDTDRDGALRVLESGDPQSAIPGHRGHSRPHRSEQARLDHRLSSRYVPSHSHKRSVSGSDAGYSSAQVRESGTTFDTSVYSQRNSQATVRTMFSDDYDSQYSAYPQSDATIVSPTRPHPPQHPSRARHANGRERYYSSQSSGSSHRRDSHVVVLDGLDEALSREHVPSQLFMEAPFIGWERAGLATTAH